MGNNLPATADQPTEISKAGPISASTLVCMILKTDKIQIEGFDKPQVKCFAPGIRFVSIEHSGRSDISAEIAWQSSKTRKILLVTAAIVSTALMLGAAMIALISTNVAPLDRGVLRPISWTPIRVTESGVLIRSGVNEVTIYPGNRLPNGEILLSSSKERSSYTTTNGTTTLNGKQ